VTSLQRGLIRVLSVGAECGREGEDTRHTDLPAKNNGTWRHCSGDWYVYCVWARNAEWRGKGEDTCHTDLPAKK